LKVLPDSNRQEAVPAFCTELERLHSVLLQAYTPLQEKVDRLSTDWDTRPVSFWQEILTALPAIRQAVQPCIEYATGDRQNFPCCFSRQFISIRYSLLGALYSTKSLVDDAGIAVTSYKPVSQSREIRHLHQRQHVLERLRELAEQVSQALDLMQSQFPGQTEEQKS
jgi:hypothetical protein